MFSFPLKMKCAIERGVDVINLSYGESSKWANSGCVYNLYVGCDNDVRYY